MAEKKRIEDFGQKIGGARKDMYIKKGGLTLDDLNEMTEEEKKKFVVKQNIWIKPDYEALRKDGVSPERLMFVKQVYDSLPKGNPNEHRYSDFIPFIQAYKEEIMPVLKMSDDEFREKQKTHAFYKEMYERLSDGPSVWRTSIYNSSRIYDKITLGFSQLERLVVEKKFMISDKEQFLRQKQIVYIDGENVKIEKNRWGGKDSFLSVKLQWGGTRYYYPSDSNLLAEGKYVILDDYARMFGRTFDCHPVDSKKEQEEYLQDLADAYELKMREAREQKKEIESSQPEKERKKKFLPPLLATIDREGPDCLRGLKADKDDFLEELKFRGGEYGNWENQEERQVNNDYAYEAFKDLANALNIKEESVSIGRDLAIAWGARGHSGALAHYEPARNVINLTRLKGAGSLAHEWGHALDYATRGDSELKKEMNELIEVMKYKTETVVPKRPEINKLVNSNLDRAYTWVCYQPWYKKLPEEQKDELKTEFRNTLVQAADWTNSRKLNEEVFDKKLNFTKPHFFDEYNKSLQEKTGYKLDLKALYNLSKFARSINSQYNIDITPRAQQVETEYLKLSTAFDKKYSKDTMGYWASSEEMFARAFACYIHDKLAAKGIKDDYLTGHAYNGSPVPHGEEKQRIFEQIDKFIGKCKEREFLKDGHPDYDHKIIETLSKENKDYTKEEVEKAVKENKDLSYLQLSSLFSSSREDMQKQPERIRYVEQLKLFE